jgi:hypothetical protein
MIFTMMSNPYTAPPSMLADHEPRVPRSVTAAVWCGIVAPLTIAIPCLCTLVYWAWLVVSMDRNVIQRLSAMDPHSLMLLSLMATLPIPLAFGIYKRSRICAAFVLLAFSAATVWSGISGRLIWDSTVVAPIVFIATSTLGLIGTILHHRRKAAVYSA